MPCFGVALGLLQWSAADVDLLHAKCANTGHASPSSERETHSGLQLFWKPSITDARPRAARIHPQPHGRSGAREYR